VRVPPAALVAASGETLALSLPARVRVGSRLPTTGEADLRPLAPLVSLRGFPWMWIVAAGALLAAAAAALWLRRRRRRRAAAEEPPPPPPGIEFEAALRALAARELPERGEMRAFAQELSWILRRYLGRRWERPGSAATRPEIVSWLPRTRLCVREQGRIAAWLEEADRIKFAGHRPPLADARALAEGASAIVRRTEELFEPPPSDEAAAAEGGPAPGGGT
jgi:LPXTG-motif cell wall-anchored protein